MVLISIYTINLRLFLPRFQSSLTENSLKYIGVKIWNAISREIKKLPFLKFKNAYKNLVLLKYDVDTTENINMNHRPSVQETNFCFILHFLVIFAFFLRLSFFFLFSVFLFVLAVLFSFSYRLKA